MASFGDCIRSAQKQGVLSEDEADALIARYEEHRSARAAVGERDPEGAAKTALTAEMEAEAARKKFIARLATENQAEVRNYLETYRDRAGNPNAFEAAANLLESFGRGAGTSSVRNRALAIYDQALSGMADVLSTFRRNRFTGMRKNQPQMKDVVREILGQATGDADASIMAKAIAEGGEKLREAFNKAGGNIGKIEGGYLPQYHDPAALIRVGYEAWRNAELPRLDLNKMRDPITGGPLTPERLEAGMRASWERTVTEGWSDREVTRQAFGKGALVNRHAEHRFLHYKDADAWLASDREFGRGDPTKAIFGHMRNMASDIAAMELLGPNPTSTLAWLKNVIESEAAKSQIGKPSLVPGMSSQDGKAAAARLEAIYDTLRGPAIASNWKATAAGDVSNLLTSAYLGGTSILAASTDPFIDRMARSFNGLPAMKALWGIVHAFRVSNDIPQMVRLGLGMDDFLHVMGNEARWSGALGGSPVTRWLADRTVNLNGLEPITQARKWQFGRDFLAMAADQSGNTFGELNPYFRRALENYGLKEKDWNAIRKTELYIPKEGSAGFLRPGDIKSRELGLRFHEMILGETEGAVPTGTARSRSIVTGAIQRGTTWGELLNSGLQFKSFTLSFTTLQWQAMMQEVSSGASRTGMVARGAGYAGALMIPLTMGGAASIQINNLISTKDMQPMDPTTGQGMKFWLAAMFKGGGLGLMGDFLFQDYTRFGHTPIEQFSGPTVGLISDAAKLIIGNVQKAATGKKTNVARETINMLGKLAPVVASHPFTRAAYQRIVLDQLQYATDPEAHKHFRDAQQRLKRETGGGYYWPPGASSPERAPEWPSARK